jgi:hypothetical protein
VAKPAAPAPAAAAAAKPAVGKSTLFGDDDDDDDPILGGNKKAAAPAKASPAGGSAAAKPAASKVCAPHAITNSIFTTFRSRCSGTTTTTTSLIRSQRHRNLLPSPLQPVHFPSPQPHVALLIIFAAAKGKSLFDDDDD